MRASASEHPLPNPTNSPLVVFTYVYKLCELGIAQPAAVHDTQITHFVLTLRRCYARMKIYATRRVVHLYNIV